MKIRKEVILICIYSLLVILLFAAAKRNFIVLFFLWVPYVLFGDMILTFGVGWLVQRFAKTRTLIGRLLYGMSVLVAPFIGYMILNRWESTGEIHFEEVFRKDLYIAWFLSFVGCMLGQLFEARKQRKGNNEGTKVL